MIVVVTSFYRTQAMSSFLFSSYLLHFNCKFVYQKGPSTFGMEILSNTKNSRPKTILKIKMIGLVIRLIVF